MIIVSDAVDFLRAMANNSCDALVTSPPYNIDVKYDVYDDKLSDDEYVEWTLTWVREALRVAKSGLFLNIGAKASGRTQLYYLLGRLTEIADMQNTVIWCKSVHVVDKSYGHFKPINSEKYINNTFEYVFHLVRKKEHVNISKLAVGVPFEDKSNIKRFKGNGGDLRCRGSVWFVPYKTRNEKLEHPATYSIELAEMMIKLSGAATVCDPFMGSGTTAVAAVRLGVCYSGCDISENYVFQAQMRVAGEIFDGAK